MTGDVEGVTGYGAIPNVVVQDADLLQSSKPGYGTRSVLDASLNIVNATVGSGVIGLPFALLLSGFTLGIIISIFVGLLTFVAIYSMIWTGQRSQLFNFPSLAEVAMGRFGYHMLNLMLFIQSAGCIISYFILVADTIPVLLGLYFPQYPLLADRQFVTVLVAIFVVGTDVDDNTMTNDHIKIFPLNLFRSIGALAKWSIFAVLLLPVMILAVLIRAPVYAPDHDAPLFKIGKDPIGAMGIMSFAFVCTQVAFSNYLSQKNQSMSAWKLTSGLSTGMSWSISILFAVIGYLSFGQDVSSNIFSNFPADDNIVNIGRLSLGVSIILTVPMAFYPARDSVQKMIGFETTNRQPTNIQHYTVTTILFTFFLICGIRVHSLGKVYSLVGGIASSFLAYIIPGLSYIAVFHPKWLKRPELLIEDDNKDIESIWWLDIASIILVGFGSIVMLFTALNAF
ncbi:hypothetical protein G6F16_008634 [Rhizopus arrhizus]|nr:hypothetical protein G6F23_011407 [Rhizopus arrhizus]KAG0760049.1 hypothetical protein G6F24_008611 [Rhizopus arrhizus]KAG0780037.1 hypothetical protein G6F21_012319 [Rhizopus arrhizus]KAG0798379.1 hypothetical protein G6F22_004283 [Rhizopus arrhizus]KAG0804893.1 hypothetical protein G6F20_012340 [Rhizopus arrhizus]